MKKLTRSRDNKVLAGVLGGIGEYLDTDPVFVRLLYVLGTLATGILPGILGYVLALIIVPQAAGQVHEAQGGHDSTAV